MTDPIDEAIWRTGFTVLSAGERDSYARHFLEALTVALEATRLAVETANEAPRTASLDYPTIPQIFEQWAAANLLVHTAFGNLHKNARHVIDVIQPVMPND